MQDIKDLFDADYYAKGLGSPYERSPEWLRIFGDMAEEIIRSLKPKSVLDAGCALGFLVESLWDRGVEAYGIDISEFAISQVRRDMQAYCRQASIVDPLERRYDLITCIEVLEHLLPEQTETAIANLAAATDTILFSSDPSDITETTHFNVRPTIGWIKLFKNAGFWPDYIFDAGFVAPHAILFRKEVPQLEDSFPLFSDRTRWKSAYVERQRQNAVLNEEVAQLTAITADYEQADNATRSLLEKRESALRDSQIALSEAQAENGRLLKRLGELQGELTEVSNEVSQLRDSEARSLRVAQLTHERLVAQKQLEIEGCRGELSQTVCLAAPAIVELARLRFRKELEPLSVLLAQGWEHARLAFTFRHSALRKKQGELLRHLELVWGSPLFDPFWYLKAYPDVATANINPLLHFLGNGASEGRNPGPGFDAAWYLGQYPDVAAAGVNPLVHYLEFGADEGREIRPVETRRSAK